LSSDQDLVVPAEGAATLVVLPSLSFSVAELVKIKGIVHYEERLLCSALFLRRPGLRIVYLTSMPVAPDIVDYYLGFLANPADARRRLHLVAVGEAGPRPLTDKLLDAPGALGRVRELLSDGAPAVLAPFNITPAEWALAEALGVPVDGPRAELVVLGSKTGSRRVARRAGVGVFEGDEGLFSLEEVADAVEELRARRPRAARAVVKLNNGFSGQGNAMVNIDGPVGEISDSPATFCAAGESWPSFASKIAAEGAIVEELADDAIASPSVQLRITPGGAVEVVSTHDQVLGGPGGQVYLGCRFPASPGYRPAICDAARRVGAVLAAQGMVGPFGIDFLVVPGRNGVQVRLSEINLRMGGTTHPFRTARLVTGGAYDAVTGELVADGRATCYVATDNLTSPGLAGMSPAAAIEVLERAGLAYDRTAGRGTVLHLLGALPFVNKVGATCMAGTTEEADVLFSEVAAVLMGGPG
jgi:hypothetical protein